MHKGGVLLTEVIGNSAWALKVKFCGTVPAWHTRGLVSDLQKNKPGIPGVISGICGLGN